MSASVSSHEWVFYLMTVRDDILAMTVSERAAWILGHALSHNVPDEIIPNKFMPTNWPSFTINEGGYTLETFPMPDFLSLTKEGFYLCVRPDTLQHIASAWGCVMASRKLVRLLALSSQSQRVPLQIPGKPFIIPSPKGTPKALSMESPQAMLAHSDLIHKIVRDKSKKFFTGHSKTVVCGPNTTGSHLAIYGGSGGPVDKWCWQPYSIVVREFFQTDPSDAKKTVVRVKNEGPHDWFYEDYSQLGQLWSRYCRLNGKDDDLLRVGNDPKVSFLVSDQGPFPFMFPNAAGGVPSSPLGGTPTAIGGGPASGGGKGFEPVSTLPARPFIARTEPSNGVALALSGISFACLLIEEYFHG